MQLEIASKAVCNIPIPSEEYDAYYTAGVLLGGLNSTIRNRYQVSHQAEVLDKSH